MLSGFDKLAQKDMKKECERLDAESMLGHLLSDKASRKLAVMTKGFGSDRGISTVMTTASDGRNKPC